MDLLFWAPISSENCGEFSNDSYRERHEKLNVESATTASESAIINVIVERHHKVLHESMMKTLEEVKSEPEVALAWAVSAKNALQNHNGFSTN